MIISMTAIFIASIIAITSCDNGATKKRDIFSASNGTNPGEPSMSDSNGATSDGAAKKAGPQESAGTVTPHAAGPNSGVAGLFGTAMAAAAESATGEAKCMNGEVLVGVTKDGSLICRPIIIEPVTIPDISPIVILGNGFNPAKDFNYEFKTDRNVVCILSGTYNYPIGSSSSGANCRVTGGESKDGKNVWSFIGWKGVDGNACNVSCFRATF